MVERIINAVKWRFLKARSKFLISSGIRKENVECNICGWKDFRFESDNWHPYSICPWCQSQLRQRLMVAILEHSETLSMEKIINNKKVLHFAPDECMIKSFKAITEEYKTADLLTEGYKYSHIDMNLDMSDMKCINDEHYDCLIALDVLEHIPDHTKAMREAYRVLGKGGYGIFTIPQKDGLEHTIEDLTITDPAEREKKFGQWDHWRIYGNDFKDMLEKCGFKVEVRDEKSLNEHLVSRHVLYPPIKSKHPLVTNNRKIYFAEKI